MHSLKVNRWTVGCKYYALAMSKDNVTLMVYNGCIEHWSVVFAAVCDGRVSSSQIKICNTLCDTTKSKGCIVIFIR